MINASSKARKKQEGKYKAKTEREIEKIEAMESQLENEELWASGQDDKKKGKKAAEDYAKLEEAKRKRAEQEVLNSLESKKRFASSYKENMAIALQELLVNCDWLPGWGAEVVITNGRPITLMGEARATQDGLLLVVQSPTHMYHQGIRTSNDPVLDYSAMLRLAEMTENQLDLARGSLDGIPEQRTTLPEKYRIKGIDYGSN